MKVFVGKSRQKFSTLSRIVLLFYNLSGNFAQLIQLQRRNNRILDEWFKKVKLDKYQARLFFLLTKYLKFVLFIQVSYLSYRSQEEYILLLGAEVESLVTDEINDSSFTPIMTDSTPDKTHREMCSIVVRYIKNYEVKERLLTLQELPSKLGEEICQLLLKTLKKKEY